jgi:hypothetical protein
MGFSLEPEPGWPISFPVDSAVLRSTMIRVERFDEAMSYSGAYSGSSRALTATAHGIDDWITQQIEQWSGSAAEDMSGNDNAASLWPVSCA